LRCTGDGVGADTVDTAGTGDTEADSGVAALGTEAVVLEAVRRA